MIRRTWALLCLSLGMALALCLSSVPIAVAAQEAADDDTMPQGRVGLHWQSDTLRSPRTPVLAGELVLVAHEAGIAAVRPPTGEIAWQHDTDEPPSVPFVMDGTAFVTAGGYLIALDPQTGEHRWQVDLLFGASDLLPREASGWGYAFAPTGADGVVYVLAGPIAAALQAEDGAWLWRSDFSFSMPETGPVVAGSLLMWSMQTDIGEQMHMVVDRETGRTDRTDWGELGSFMPLTSPDGTTVVVYPNNAGIVGRLTANGQETWNVYCEFTSGPAVATIGDRLVTVCTSTLTAIEPDSGGTETLYSGIATTLVGPFGSGVLIANETGNGLRLSSVLPGADGGWDVTRMADLPEGVTALRDGVSIEGRVIALSPDENGDMRLVGIGGTEGTHGAPLPFALNPPTGGTFVEIVTDTALRGAPSTEGVPWAELSTGAQVLITGTSEEVDATVWWQVADPTSGETGWVEATALDPGAD